MPTDKNSADDPFRQQLTAVLENLNDLEWLGTHSPLATLYFLGEHLLRRPEDNRSPAGRGQVLRALIWKTAQDMIQEYGEYSHKVLVYTFFRSLSVSEISHQLNISRATYYRHRYKAVQQLEAILIRQLRPALRIEEPPTCEGTLFGREAVITHCRQKLQATNMVALTGSSGIGKTALGSRLAAGWLPLPVFWYTFRPGLNDQLKSLLFTLAYFLYRQGASTLWLQLVAGLEKNGRQVDYEILLPLLRHEVSQMKGNLPLLCFDEVDILNPQDIEQHAAILTFLQSMNSPAPILLMGQQMPLPIEGVVILEGLPVPAIDQVLAEAGLQLDYGDLESLQAYTQGNPRLLRLFMTLHRSGEPLGEILSRLSSTPSVEFLLGRVWQRLDEKDQNLLMSLSVFRRSAPADAWPDRGTVDKLMQWRLVQQDEQGGISLTPVFRAIIYKQLTAEDREFLHQQAAVIRAERGEYTAAAYHYICGGQPETAVWLWDMQRRQEIDQGQGQAALQLFEQLSTSHLSGPAKETLVLLRSKLRMLAGDYGKIRADLQTISWQTPLFKGRSKRIAGDVAYESSQFDKAIGAYREALETMETVGRELALLHKEMGKVYEQKRDLDAAWQEALLAQYEVEDLKGNIQSNKGNFAEARHHYEVALDLAQALRHVEGEGRTHNNLGWLLKRQGDFEMANHHWHRASECYRQIGNMLWQAGIKINQAVGHTETGRPQAALPLLDEALSVFKSLNHPRGKAISYANLAEAHLSLGNLETAERFARHALEDEEPNVMPASFHTLAEIRLAQKQLPEAEDFCHKSIYYAQQNHDLFNEALSWRTLGKTCVAKNDEEKARQALTKAVEIFQQLELSQEIEATQIIASLLDDG
jgi:tetratricopeptide (TPR) repeat protein